MAIVPKSYRFERVFGGGRALLWVCFFGITACASHVASPAITRSQSVSAWADPTPDFGRPENTASTSESVVLLRGRASRKAMLALIEHYFEGFRSKNLAPFYDFFATSVYWQTDAAYAQMFARECVISNLITRANSLHYESLSLDSIYDERAIRFYEFDDFDLPNRPARPAYMVRDDIYALVPIATPRVGNNTFFGDSVAFDLRVNPAGAVEVVGLREEIH
jgi:hypothetical protein